MKTHLSFNGYCVRSEWNAGKAPDGAEFVARGRLVNPKGHYVEAPYVNVYFVPGKGYGYVN